MQQLVIELAEEYGEEACYTILQRVFEEHYTLEDNALRPKQGQELKADSLQSPDEHGVHPTGVGGYISEKTWRRLPRVHI